MKLKRWKVEAGMYAHGKSDYFYFHGSAMTWIRNNRQYDILSLTDRWTGKKTYLKDRLYGRAGSPSATIVLHQPGGVDIYYNDLVPTSGGPIPDMGR